MYFNSEGGMKFFKGRTYSIKYLEITNFEPNMKVQYRNNVTPALPSSTPSLCIYKVYSLYFQFQRNFLKVLHYIIVHDFPYIRFDKYLIS